MSNLSAQRQRNLSVLSFVAIFVLTVAFYIIPPLLYSIQHKNGPPKKAYELGTL
ncbi:hypothetical protein BYT27DRAFT_7203727 [Phlegmacium glaucopus]|nr:hypothetical protein BYT27DRAFT_7203727 [Phlegmacium glaucopus]